MTFWSTLWNCYFYFSKVIIYFTLLHFSKVIDCFTLLLKKVICYCYKITCNMLLPNTDNNCIKWQYSEADLACSYVFHTLRAPDDVSEIDFCLSTLPYGHSCCHFFSSAVEKWFKCEILHGDRIKFNIYRRNVPKCGNTGPRNRENLEFCPKISPSGRIVCTIF